MFCMSFSNAHVVNQTSVIFAPGTLATVMLECDNLQNLCPSEIHDERMCECIVTNGKSLRWKTNRTDVFSGTGTSYHVNINDPPVCMGGFCVRLTNNTSGELTSVMNFTSSNVNTSGLLVTCEAPNTNASSQTAILIASYIRKYIHCLSPNVQNSRCEFFCEKCDWYMC